MKSSGGGSTQPWRYAFEAGLDDWFISAGYPFQSGIGSLSAPPAVYLSISQLERGWRFSTVHVLQHGYDLASALHHPTIEIRPTQVRVKKQAEPVPVSYREGCQHFYGGFVHMESIGNVVAAYHDDLHVGLPLR